MALRVLTLNLWNRSGPYDARRERIRDWLDRLEPDLIGFQEAMRGDGFDQVPELLDGRGYEVEFSRASMWGEMEFGNAIATRWPVSQSEVVSLPDDDSGETRCALSASVDSPYGEISFTCTHLNWKLHHGSVREAQVRALTDLVLRRRPRGGFPPIVVGDFNAEPDSAEIRFMRGFASIDRRSVMFYDAWSMAGDGGPGSTWSNRNPYAAIALEPDRRIDYIFAGYPIRVGERYGVGKIETCRVVCNDEHDGAWPSDHFGVYAELRTEPLPAPMWEDG